MIGSKIGIVFLVLTLASCFAAADSHQRSSNTEGAYRFCGADHFAGVTTAQLKETIANAAMRRKAPTALDQFFADNLVIVAPAEFRDDYRSLIAYVSGSEYCGSGGCNGYVLEQRADGPGYRVVTKIVPARLPISVLPAIHNGRHDIGVIVAGGGIIHSYVGALSYDGKSYASNPTLSNIPHVKKGVGKIVLGPPGASPSQCRLR